MHAVNASAHDEHACGVAAIALIRNETVDTMEARGQAGADCASQVSMDRQRVSNMVQYAALEGGGQPI